MVRIASQNLMHGGGQTPEGTADDRWPTIATAINAQAPDVLCLQELHGWRSRNYQPLFTAQADLGMRVCGWIPGGRSIGGTLILYRDQAGLTVRQWEDKDHRELYNGLGVAVLDIGGPVPLTVASVHFSAVSIVEAESEAIKATARAYRYGGLGIVIGDVNHHPLNDPAPDPATLPALNAAALYSIADDGSIRPDRRVAERLTLARMTDAAAHLAHTQGDPALLAATGPGRIRRDQAWLTPPLVPALTSYRRIAHQGSDHDLITIDLDPTLIDSAAIKHAG